VAAELAVKLGIYVSPRTVRAYWPPERDRRGPRGSPCRLPHRFCCLVGQNSLARVPSNRDDLLRL